MSLDRTKETVLKYYTKSNLRKASDILQRIIIFTIFLYHPSSHLINFEDTVKRIY